MTRQEQIAAGFDGLRDLCDPRGHDLLDALEDLCIVENMAFETVLFAFSQEEPSNVIPLINAYSVKI